MGAATLQLPSQKDTLYLTSGFQDDFDNYVDAGRWTKVVTDSGSVAALVTTGADNGVLAIIPSDGSVADNDEAYVHSTNSPFLITANRMIQAEAGVQYAEASTNHANVFFGIMDAIAANTLVDDGAGMKASYSGAAIFKVDGGTVWKCECAIGAVKQTTASAIAAGGAALVRLRIEIRGLTSTTAEVTYWYDNGSGIQQFLDPTQIVATPIKHIITFTGAVQMQVGAGQKNGVATAVETLNVDYVSAYQTRKQ